MEEIITAIQVAEILKIHVKTVYRLTEEGIIPGNKIGGTWRFRESNILDMVPGKTSSKSANKNFHFIKKSLSS
jgi:excisionase family DNA binding protein